VPGGLTGGGMFGGAEPPPPHAVAHNITPRIAIRALNMQPPPRI
jgi:hypothetical protein